VDINKRISDCYLLSCGFTRFFWKGGSLRVWGLIFLMILTRATSRFATILLSCFWTSTRRRCETECICACVHMCIYNASFIVITVKKDGAPVLCCVSSERAIASFLMRTLCRESIITNNITPPHFTPDPIRRHEVSDCRGELRRQNHRRLGPKVIYRLSISHVILLDN
jgi:hypothetical protein